MSNCPKCNGNFESFDSQIVIRTGQAVKKTVAKICTGCSFVEFYYQ